MHFERMPWSDEAARGLANSIYDSPGFNAFERVREGVQSGKMELWRVDGTSWALTQASTDVVIVWCYEGKGARQFVSDMIAIARKNQIPRVRFATVHKGLPRLLAAFKPRKVADQIFDMEVAA